MEEKLSSRNGARRANGVARGPVSLTSRHFLAATYDPKRIARVKSNPLAIP